MFIELLSILIGLLIGWFLITSNVDFVIVDKVNSPTNDNKNITNNTNGTMN